MNEWSPFPHVVRPDCDCFPCSLYQRMLEYKIKGAEKYFYRPSDSAIVDALLGQTTYPEERDADTR